MKINLDGIFKDIKRLVDAPNKTDVKAPSEFAFDKILASISPRKDEILKKISSLHVNDTAKKSYADTNLNTMASLKFDPPELQIPESLPIQIVTPTLDSSASVKTPTLLSARRIEPNEYSKLQKPERIEAINNLAKKVGLEQGIDPALSMSIIANESSFNTQAISQDGHASKGLMQLLDTTGSQYHQQVGIKDNYDPFNPEQNVKLGVSYLRYLHDIFSKETTLANSQTTFIAANSSSLEKLAVAAYNAGEGRVASAQARAKQDGNDPTQYEQIQSYLPESTKQYVVKVMKSKLDFEAATKG